MKSIWWKQVSNARSFIAEIVDCASDGKNILLEIPDYVPWYDEMADQIEAGLKEKLDYNLEIVCDDERDPGDIILHKFCKQEKIQTYRPAIGYSRFLAESDDIVLNTRFVWVTDISPERFDAWAEFVYYYRKMIPRGKRGGIFILEMRDTSNSSSKKGITKISYKKSVGNYDCFVFYAMASALNSKHVIIKQYLAELVTAIAGNDIEMGAECLRTTTIEKMLDNPWEAVKEIAETRIRSNGQDFVIPRHEDGIQQSIWNAQIKTIFPIIEGFRRNFVEHYYNRIQDELPITNSIGEDVTDPKEVEIGTLLYLICERNIQILPEEHNKLHAFRDARNDLAHLKVLGKEQLENIVRLADM